MGKFQFSKNVIKLDIEGVVYEVPGDTEYFKTIIRCGEKMVERSAQEGSADLFELTEFMVDILEELLGVEMVDSIFSEREPEYYDCIELFKYVTSEVKAYHQSKMGALIPNGVEPVSTPALPNRAARRAEQRRKSK